MTDRVCQGCEARRSFLKRAADVVAGYLALGAIPTFVAGARLAPGDELSYPVPAGDGVMIDRENELILARRGKQVIAFALSCPHQRTVLKWSEPDDRFQCPKHKSKYQPTGEFISGRATRNMDRYPIRVEGGKVIVTVTRTIESDKDPRGWEAAVVAA